MPDLDDRPFADLTLRELEDRLQDLQDRLPAHSVRPWQIAELEDLEEEIARRRRAKQGTSDQDPIPR